MKWGDTNQDFLELLNRHEHIIHKLVRMYSAGQEDGRDLFQEIVYQLWKGYRSFKGESAFSTWMYRVALNTAITSLRRSKRMPAPSELDEGNISQGPREAPQQNENLQLLHRSIKMLNKVDRALVMLYLDDLSYKEIAEIMGISEDNVGVKLNRVKAKLRSHMGQLE